MKSLAELDAAPTGKRDEFGPPPDLNPAHVRWRVDSKPITRDGKTTARFVPYVTMERLAGLLDDWVGPARWWAEFEPAGKTMWCRITLVTVSGIQITKIDVGDIDGSIKAAISDSFKRCAARMWGVGREVRSIPTLWAPCRVYRSNAGEDVAVANNDTIPTLRRKLANLGHAGFGVDADGSELLDPDAVGEAQTSPPLNPNDVDQTERDLLTSALDELSARVDLLDDPGRTHWQGWKDTHTGWHKSLGGVHDAARAVEDLIAQAEAF